MSFQTIINSDATTTGPQTNAAASAADPNAWASTLGEMAYNAENAGNIEKQHRKPSVRTDSNTILIGREELKSCIQLETKSAFEAIRGKEMRGLDEKTVGEVFITKYYGATDSIKDYSFSFVEEVIMNMINRRVLHETLYQNFERWSRSDAFMEALNSRIVNHPGSIVPVAAFFKQHATNAVKEELNREPKVTTGTMSPSD